MVFTEVPQALLFRIELNTNYLCAFIVHHTRYRVQHYNLQLLTEIIEDRLNLIDILKHPVINFAEIIKEELSRYASKHQDDS